MVHGNSVPLDLEDNAWLALACEEEEPMVGFACSLLLPDELELHGRVFVWRWRWAVDSFPGCGIHSTFPGLAFKGRVLPVSMGLDFGAGHVCCYGGSGVAIWIVVLRRRFYCFVFWTGPLFIITTPCARDRRVGIWIAE